MQAFNNLFSLKDLPPHVYAISALTYKQLFENEKKQAIVISGESGAGKTENTKSCMKFLTSLFNVKKKKSNSIEKNKKEDVVKEISVEDKILSCNPILEAFGNAKTVRNDNSSRFGKYVSLLFKKTNREIVGATMINYLLEKSRIISPGPGERSYHIFYFLIKGASVNDLKNLGLTENGEKIQMEKLNCLKKSECFEVKNINDVALYEEVKDSFKVFILLYFYNFNYFLNIDFGFY